MKRNAEQKAGNNSNLGESAAKSLIQKAVTAGLALYNNKDTFIDKTQKVVSKVYGENQELTLDDAKEKLFTLGRLVKSVGKGEYTNVSPMFFVKAGFAIAYLRYGNDFLPDDGTFIGVADDIAVISWALKALADEINKYEVWEKNSPVNAEFQPVAAS